MTAPSDLFTWGIDPANPPLPGHSLDDDELKSFLAQICQEDERKVYGYGSNPFDGLDFGSAVDATTEPGVGTTTLSLQPSNVDGRDDDPPTEPEDLPTTATVDPDVQRPRKMSKHCAKSAVSQTPAMNENEGIDASAGNACPSPANAPSAGSVKSSLRARIPSTGWTRRPDESLEDITNAVPNTVTTHTNQYPGLVAVPFLELPESMPQAAAPRHPKGGRKRRQENEHNQVAPEGPRKRKRNAGRHASGDRTAQQRLGTLEVSGSTGLSPIAAAPGSFADAQLAASFAYDPSFAMPGQAGPMYATGFAMPGPIGPMYAAPAYDPSAYGFASSQAAPSAWRDADIAPGHWQPYAGVLPPVQPVGVAGGEGMRAPEFGLPAELLDAVDMSGFDGSAFATRVGRSALPFAAPQMPAPAVAGHDVQVAGSAYPALPFDNATEDGFGYVSPALPGHCDSHLPMGGFALPPQYAHTAGPSASFVSGHISQLLEDDGENQREGGSNEVQAGPSTGTIAGDQQGEDTSADQRDGKHAQKRNTEISRPNQAFKKLRARRRHKLKQEALRILHLPANTPASKLPAPKRVSPEDKALLKQLGPKTVQRPITNAARSVVCTACHEDFGLNDEWIGSEDRVFQRHHKAYHSDVVCSACGMPVAGRDVESFRRHRAKCHIFCALVERGWHWDWMLQYGLVQANVRRMNDEFFTRDEKRAARAAKDSVTCLEEIWTKGEMTRKRIKVSEMRETEDEDEESADEGPAAGPSQQANDGQVAGHSRLEVGQNDERELSVSSAADGSQHAGARDGQGSRIVIGPGGYLFDLDANGNAI